MINRRPIPRYKRRHQYTLADYLKPQYCIIFFTFFACIICITFLAIPQQSQSTSITTSKISDKDSLENFNNILNMDHREVNIPPNIADKLLQNPAAVHSNNIEQKQNNKNDQNNQNINNNNNNNNNIININENDQNNNNNDNNNNYNYNFQTDVNGRVQIFYYPWYGNPSTDGKYIHWNHDVLPHWQDSENAKYKNIGKLYNPDNDEIGANFYPKLGAYSSANVEIIKQHFRALLSINVTVLIVSWHSPEAIKNNPNKAFSEKDKITANNLDLLFAIATNDNEFVNKIFISIHLEPYNGRTAESTYNDILYINKKYGKSNALYRSKEHNNLPFYYCYDSYRLSGE